MPTRKIPVAEVDIYRSGSGVGGSDGTRSVSGASMRSSSTGKSSGFSGYRRVPSSRALSAKGAASGNLMESTYNIVELDDDESSDYSITEYMYELLQKTVRLT